MRVSSGHVNQTNPYLRGVYAPVARESSDADLTIIGELPADLDGVFVRNGPNPKHEPIGRYHWFDGDGMLHAVRFEGGRARYRCRWVKTAQLAIEEQAGESLWRGLMEPTVDNPPPAPYKDSANTDVVYFGGELLATWYLCGHPYRVDPETLETRGVHAFGGAKPPRISAHAKVDPVTGELLFFAYGSRPALTYGVVAADGELAHKIDIPLPGPRLPHDMAMTKNYAILMDLPVFPTAKSISERRWQARFHPELPARFGLVPRRGSAAEVRWFEAEPCYIYHTINAWEEGDEVVLIGCRIAEPFVRANHERDGEWARMMANLTLRAELYEWRFHLPSGTTKERPLDDRNTEFPAINQGRLGSRSRFSYNASIADAPTLLFDGIVKYDTETDSSCAYEYGPGRYGSEPGFAPRGGGDGRDGGEDDGYVVSMVFDEREQRSELLVFEARQLEAGPRARVVLPARVPIGFHACWVPGAALSSGR